MRKLARVAPLTLALALVGDTASAGALVPVVTGRVDEFQPAAGPGHVAWSANTPAHPQHYDVYVRPSGEGRYRVNPEGSSAYMGGIDGATLVYQQARYQRGASDVKFFDLESGEHTNPPSVVNTRHWEYWPSLSGDQLLFARIAPNGQRRILLMDLLLDEMTVVAEMPPSEGSQEGMKRIVPGQVNGGFAVWGRQTPSTCDVFLYDIAAGENTRIPGPRSRCRFGPSVAPDGTVYFGESGLGCGINSKLRRYPPGGPAVTLHSFPNDVDFLRSFVFDTATQNEVFLDPGPCDGDLDIRKLVDPLGP